MCLFFTWGFTHASCQLQVPALANKDAPVFQHLFGPEKCKVSEEVFNLPLPAGMRTVDDLDDVFLLDRVLLRVQGHRVLVLTFLLKSGRPNTHNLSNNNRKNT